MGIGAANRGGDSADRGGVSGSNNVDGAAFNNDGNMRLWRWRDSEDGSGDDGRGDDNDIPCLGDRRRRKQLDKGDSLGEDNKLDSFDSRLEQQPAMAAPSSASANLTSDGALATVVATVDDL
ncbi:hypothetical protein DM860_002199 [Cuscuta australis]|uniref:Uncharacterized protein n=1 Tax=Cuscuta australis TaxID=267555 RepID=A0A328DZI8_9ASTE|nr:hypothetical protein DM860_002199 [Cuscuta australis]